MKRVFLMGALSLTTLCALAALLAVQAKDRSYFNGAATVVNASSEGVTELPQVETGEDNSRFSVSKFPLDPNYDPAKDPMRLGYTMMKEARESLYKNELDIAERKCREALQFFHPTYMASLPKELLGDIQLAKGQYEEALESYGVARSHSANPGMSLNVALCYIRLGDYENAKKSYSDRYMLRFTGISQEDLPGTDTPQTLEASILLARGVEAKTSSDSKGALANFEPASKLAPRNGLLAYDQAMVLMRLKRYDEALPMWTRVVRFGNARQVKDAKSTMIQMWPRAKAEAAISAAAKIP